MKPSMDLPILFEGKSHLGQMLEDGQLTGFYLLEGDCKAPDSKG